MGACGLAAATAKPVWLKMGGKEASVTLQQIQSCMGKCLAKLGVAAPGARLGTPDLGARFDTAVRNCGGLDAATPKAAWRTMGREEAGVTREQLKSRLSWMKERGGGGGDDAAGAEVDLVSDDDDEGAPPAAKRARP